MNDMRLAQTIVGLLLAVLSVRFAQAGPFASTVVEFAPAPGQFANDSNFNDPRKALGPPSSGGTGTPNNASVVSLGGFGGFITLGFEQTVFDDPLNPLGLDAIVFSNAFWVGGNPQRHWAECAIVEISLDSNGNGMPDDPWYLIPGSHVLDPELQFMSVIWDDDIDDPLYPPDDAAWIPPGYRGQWITETFALPLTVFGLNVLTNPSLNGLQEGIYGYAEYSPTLVLGDLDANNTVDDPALRPEEFYAIPDDPFMVGITPGSGGGDAFDIAWAIDPLTRLAADLPGFDFIRMTTAVNVVDGTFAAGEKSAEIDAVADVAPDPFGDSDEDGDIDMVNLAGLQNCFRVLDGGSPVCDRFDRASDGIIAWDDALAVIARMTGPR